MEREITMATIKSFTDLSQSKTLSKILPLESADMYWYKFYKNKDTEWTVAIRYEHLYDGEIPCWSLAALLGVLPNGTDIIKEETDTENEKYMCTVGVKYDSICTFGNNPVDACVAMIEKLHELNLL